MVSKPGLAAKLYQDISAWPISQDLGRMGIHPVVPGYRLLRLDERLSSTSLPTFEVVMLCDTTKEVVYYNRVLVTSISDASIKAAALSLVWRSSDFQHDVALQKIAVNVLTHYVLEQHIAILSDGNQGIFFWESLVSAAMSRGNNAYAYKAMPAELEHIKDRDDFILLKDAIWGNAGAFGHNLVILSKDSLPLEKTFEIPMDIVKEVDQVDIQEVLEKELGSSLAHLKELSLQRADSRH